MPTPHTFFRYRSFNTYTLSSLCEDELYFSHPGDFNDPLDCSPTVSSDSSNEDLQKLLAFFVNKRVTSEIMGHLSKAKIKGSNAFEHAEKQALREVERNLAGVVYNSTNPDYEGTIEERKSRLLISAITIELQRGYERGICCFSESYKSPLLWSHYGDQHKGICIGYSVDRNPLPKLRKVQYGGSRSIKSSILCDAFLYGNMPIDDIDTHVLLQKARGWKYESEWRLIGKQGLQPSPLLLTEVIFGIRCQQSVKYAVIKALEKRHNEIDFYEMYAVQHSFALHRHRVQVQELEALFPVIARSGIEVFGPSK